MTGSGFNLIRKDWDSDFFRREIYSLEVGESLDLATLCAGLDELDQRGVWGVECHLDVESFSQAPLIEDAGFRLVDSRATFISQMTRDAIPQHSLTYGLIRTVEPDDMARVEDLTSDHLVDNPQFRSRFKDRRLFSRDESIRYYDAWNERAFQDHPDLFAVWDVDGEVVAYFTYLEAGTSEGLPLFKGGLTAVDPAHRGHSAQNALQVFLFSRFGVERWALDNTTQITNTAVLRNHMRAGKIYRGATLTFYRVASGVG